MRVPVFQAGFRLFDGTDLNALLASLFSAEAGITAHAGGTKAAAYQLTAANNEISVCASSSDSVKLPAERFVGLGVWITNNGAQTVQVFGYGSDTINGVATATGVSQATGKSALYKCVSISAADVAAWDRILSA